MDQLRLDVPDVKPEYSVPLMSEIATTQANGLKVVSTFSGCGGSCLGFKMAGFTALMAVEFVPAAADTYHENFPDVPLVVQDVRDLDGELILTRLGLRRGELDVLEGSPPCASFSTAGKRDKAWGQVKKYSDVEQRTDDLFDEYIRLVDQLRPKTFVAENVEGLTMGIAANGRAEATPLDGIDDAAVVEALEGYLDRIIGAMRSLNYSVEFRILNASRHGVPQARRRMIIVGVRRDMGVSATHCFPEQLPYTYSIRDAIGLEFSGHEIARGRRSLDSDLPLPTVQTHGNLDTFSELSVPVEDDDISLEGYAIGREWDRMAADEEMGVTSRVRECPVCHGTGVVQTAIYGTRALSQERGTDLNLDKPSPTVLALSHGPPSQFEMHETQCEECRGRGKLGYFSLVRPDADKPLPTVTQAAGKHPGVAGVTHPTQKRKFTMAELRRLCGFPDDFILTGTYAQQWERLGRAVPPPMMRRIAETICREVFQGGDR